MDLSKASFWGYRRENGRVGVRNHVVILPVDDLSNAAAQAVENNVKGTLALPHPYGRLQFGADLERSEEHTSELQSRSDLVCRLLLEKKKKTRYHTDFNEPQMHDLAAGAATDLHHVLHRYSLLRCHRQYVLTAQLRSDTALYHQMHLC